MRRQILTKIKDIEKIAREISKIKNVEAIYLFGSQSRGNTGPLSDIDICIIGGLTEKEKSRVYYFSSDNLDISFFEQLPIIIQFRILKEGKKLFVRDRNKIDELKIRIIKNYIDFKYVINAYCKEILKCTI